MKFVIFLVIGTFMAFSSLLNAKRAQPKSINLIALPGNGNQAETGSNGSLDKKYQTMDLNQFDGLKDQSPGMKLNAKVNCKSSSGTEYKSGEAGFDQCVRASAKSGQFQNNEQKAQNEMEFSLGK
jgi:hypothetical protein